MAGREESCRGEAEPGGPGWLASKVLLDMLTSVVGLDSAQPRGAGHDLQLPHSGPPRGSSAL